jgi:NAD(P)H-hydrate repair Nnr-like enzyme with NAD(P)H-hydrate epimerase domain
MELAGLACAQTLATVYGKERYPRVLVCCGPGNQGGDGLVAARHLGTAIVGCVRECVTGAADVRPKACLDTSRRFGSRRCDCSRSSLPRTTADRESNPIETDWLKGHLQGRSESLPLLFVSSPDTLIPLYAPSPQRLHAQCTNMHIPTLPAASDADLALAETALSTALTASDVVLDAIFGFSFKPPVRAPFDAALPLIARSGLPIVSVDIPSGWDVEGGADAGASGQGRLVLYPDVLVSLTAPKEGVRKFTGRHFLGGRFVPK